MHIDPDFPDIMTNPTSLEKAWQLEEVLKERIVIIDGAMGTMIQVIELGV